MTQVTAGAYEPQRLRITDWPSREGLVELHSDPELLALVHQRNDAMVGMTEALGVVAESPSGV